MTSATISANRTTPQERAMRNAWTESTLRNELFHGPVPSENARIRALEASKKVLRQALREETDKRATGFWRGFGFGALIVAGALVGVAI